MAPQTKGGLSFFLGGCMMKHPSFKGYSSTLPKTNLSKQMSSVYSLLQKALVLFSKLSS